MDSMVMKNEQHQAHDEEYAASQWADVNGYHSPQHQSPVHEFNGAYGYISPAHLPLEPAYAPAIPPAPPYSTHQPMRPLVMPQWPSMLTNPSTGAPPIAPAPPPLAPVSSIITAHPVPVVTSSTGTSTARRTLTDQDRRRMCQYHEDNPTVKQTEIGSE